MSYKSASCGRSLASALGYSTGISCGAQLPAEVRGVTHWWRPRTEYLQLTSPDVDSWTDAISGLAMTQSTAANKPHWAATGFGRSQGGILYDGSNDMLSAAAQATTNYLHQSGGTVFMCLEHGSTNPSGGFTNLIRTKNNGAAAHGFLFAGVPSTGALRFQLGNGTGTYVYEKDFSSFLQTDNTAHWVAVCWDASTMDAYASGGLSDTGTAAVGSFSGIDSGLPATLGRDATTQPFEGTAGDILFFNAKLTEQECRLLGRYFAQVSGVAV